MLVGIHSDQYQKLNSFIKKYEYILDYNGISHIRLDINESEFWAKIKLLDLFIFRWIHYDWSKQLAHTILPVIEKEMGIKCFPNQKTCWHYDDKIRQYYLLKSNCFPIIDSWIFWDKRKALQWVNTTRYPIIFKLKSGAGSLNVILVKNPKQAKYFINKMFGKGVKSSHIPSRGNLKYYDIKSFFNIIGKPIVKKSLKIIGGPIWKKFQGKENERWEMHKNYISFQKFLPNNEFDTRITVIGNRAFAFRRFNRKKDFRASGSGKINYEMDKIDIQFLKTAFEMSQKMKFQSMAYDFLYNEKGEGEFCEISYTYSDKAVWNCPGYWDNELNWHEGHYWPQYFHLMDGLNLQDLKQPKNIE